VIHAREALDDVIQILEEWGFAKRRVVFHCFTGTADEASRIASLGWWLSFTGVVTFKNSEPLRDIAREYPADRLMVETDSPYLSPVPVRSIQPNTPANLVHTVRFLGELRGVSYDSLVEQTALNSRTFFDL
jgi:TatD DNase family protein